VAAGRKNAKRLKKEYSKGMGGVKKERKHKSGNQTSSKNHS
jgi:hypothetical protein